MNDLVKYITEQVVTYMNMSSEERSKRKKQVPKQVPTQAVYTNRWLGIVPFALKTMWKKAE